MSEPLNSCNENMVLHIGYVYLILIETGLKTILAILRIVYLEEKLQNMLRRNRCFITLQGTCHKSCHKSGTAIRKWSKLWSFCNSICTSLAFGGNTSLCSYNVPILRQQLVSCFEKETMYPFPKQHKRSFKIQKKSTVTHYLLFMSYSMPI